ncbi:YdcF family protein [Marinobacter adhaerens]|uniref:YdcF family protein n=1 Tax=Marinobacter adhaerens TaxID=1033846 RepID=A0A851HXV9_9GAMM|nr:YdcF family protein [Marinobacter adhaerens]NWN91775.1 YdcF family protein [Marinobacter adhaerens]
MFVLSKFAIALISPLGSSLLGGLLAIIAGVSGFRRVALAFGVLSLVWLWAWSLPVTSYVVRGYLENQNPPVNVEAMPNAEAIVVLGGGTSPLQYGQEYPNLGPASDREWHGVRLFKAGKAPLIVLSGGFDPAYSASSSAEAMRRFMLALGVQDAALLLEPQSRNTTQNAQYTANLLGKRGIKDILLVTSALHMPRSIALFEAQGFEVTPAATDHEVRPLPGWRLWMPNTNALDGSSRALKEIVGRLAGR